MSQDQQSTHRHQKGFTVPKKRICTSIRKRTPRLWQQKTRLCDVSKSPKKADFDGTKLRSRCTT